MSTINSLSNHSLKVYSQNAVDSSSNQVKHAHSHKSHSLAVSDQVSISSDGIQALEENRVKETRIDPLESLVKDGSITKEQKDAIEDALWAAMESQQTASTSRSQNVSTQTDPLASLVSSGTITEDQKTSIQKTLFDLIDALENNDSASSTNSSSDSTSTANNSFMDEILKKLVADGSISDDQKTAITQSLQNYSNFGSDN